MMIRRALTLGVLIVLGQVQPAAAVTTQRDPQTAITAALEAARAGNCKAVLPIVAEQTTAAGLAKLNDQGKLAFYQLGLGCAADLKQPELALRYAQAGTRLPGAAPILWRGRFAFAWETGQHGEAVAAVEGMAQASPEALNTLPIRTWFYISRELKGEPALRRRLLTVLAAPGYAPSEPGWSNDYFRHEYATILADAGDKAGAAAMVALIEEPRSLIRMSLDPRLRDAIPANFDARSAVERFMASMREIAATHDSALRPQLNVAESLTMLERGEEALATLLALDPTKKANGSYSDGADETNWWWNSKAKAYAILGRYEEAVAAFSAGVALGEGGQPNISQTINLSALQLRFGHAADALVTLAPVAEGKVPASPFGKMQFRGVHGCASFQVGKLDDAKADLAYIREHNADAPASLTELQLCMGDIEGAAASIIKRLDTPDHRIEALLELSDFAPSVATNRPGIAEMALPVLKARADVQAAIARAGGIRSFNIPR